MQKYLYERSITRFIYRKKNYLLIISLTCKYVSSFVPACWIWIRERHVRWWEIINGISEKSKRIKTANCQIYSFLPQNQNYKLFIWIWRRWVVTLFHVSESRVERGDGTLKWLPPLILQLRTHDCLMRHTGSKSCSYVASTLVHRIPIHFKK